MTGFLIDILVSLASAFVVQFILSLFGCLVPFYILFIMCFVCRQARH